MTANCNNATAILCTLISAYAHLHTRTLEEVGEKIKERSFLAVLCVCFYRRFYYM